MNKLPSRQVEPGEGASRPCPLGVQRDPRLLAFPAAFFFSLLMLFACLLMPSEYSTFILLCLLFWLAAALGAASLTLRQGSLIVNAPRLAVPASLTKVQ